MSDKISPTPPPQPEEVGERLKGLRTRCRKVTTRRNWTASFGSDISNGLTDALTLIESQRKDYNEACEAVRHLEARVREWRESSDAANELLRKVNKWLSHSDLGKGSPFHEQIQTHLIAQPEKEDAEHEDE